MAESLQNIYKRMGDAMSGRIYLDRLNYSITSDKSILERMTDEAVRSRREWQTFLELLKRRQAGYFHKDGYRRGGTGSNKRSQANHHRSASQAGSQHLS